MFRSYQTAIHEAAHAVIAVRCGYPVEYVTMEPDENHSLPHCKTGELYDDDDQLTAGQAFDCTLKEGLVALAGAFAVGKALGKPPTLSTKRNDYNAALNQAEIMAKVSGRKPGDCYALIVKTLEEIMVREWPHIEHVAGELQKQKRLTGDQVRSLLTFIPR